MGRVNLSDDAVGKLAEVICTDIHTNIVKGVTYILLEEKPNTKVRLDMYMGLRTARGLSQTRYFGFTRYQTAMCLIWNQR